MRNFKINDPNEPEPTSPARLWEVGTNLTFRKVGDQIKAAISIQVVFA